ncbi:hypothetical protein NBH16_04055 [Parabacteroides sp. Y3-G-102]|uniref:hypothetical protein n=1 Tax=Parabacteroides sp. Y3-G-102 TaxID=2949649 RepID=UPI00202FF827|nr:hypothetical protein [Parabacteroides sp. Y3-G-102]MCM0726901.1 hypothetical protein [Parabacteroides sp. Y3-G-102]
MHIKLKSFFFILFIYVLYSFLSQTGLLFPLDQRFVSAYQFGIVSSHVSSDAIVNQPQAGGYRFQAFARRLIQAEGLAVFFLGLARREFAVPVALHPECPCQLRAHPINQGENSLIL